MIVEPLRSPLEAFAARAGEARGAAAIAATRNAANFIRISRILFMATSSASPVAGLGLFIEGPELGLDPMKGR
jgi:ornithine cyclodeaminase/alanine dehydrogenase-like protein (mu-crystallin family)